MTTTGRQLEVERTTRLRLSSASSPWASVMQRMTAFALLTVMVFGLNFHIFLFQMYGWSGMLLDYRETTQSWSAAAQQTISGDSPCNVCRQVESAIFARDASLNHVSGNAELPFFSWLVVLLGNGRQVVNSPPSFLDPLIVPWLDLPLLTFSPDAPPPRVAWI